MSDKSAIQWTDATWNPVRGCVKVSPGCAHCYAETFAERFRGVKGHAYEQGFDLRLVPEKLKEPLRWKKPRRVFVNSMSDLFQDGVPAVYIEWVFSVMALADRHTFQVLTKRPERMLAWFRARRFDVKGYAILQTENEGECYYAHPWPLPNVWLGTSVENQHWADKRIPVLLETPAAVRFVSYEPALGPVDFYHHLHIEQAGSSGDWKDKRLGWIIVGGESGQGARPFNLAWARSTLAQCKLSGVPCFVKQLGKMPYEGESPFASGPAAADCRLFELDMDRSHGGDWNEWPADLRVREFPEVAHGTATS